MKKETIKINNKNYQFKNADMFPHDINWENLNINKTKRFIRIIFSYFLIIIVIFVYFLIIIVLSKLKKNFERKYNLNTDCSNIDYKNNNILFKEFINKEQNEKEKIYTYCYCASELNGEEINFDNSTFDPCKHYNKYKYNRKILIYILSAIQSLIGFLIPKKKEKIISIQKLESKSKTNNLITIISTIILLFENFFL